VRVRRGRVRLREHRWTGGGGGRPLAIAVLERL